MVKIFDYPRRVFVFVRERMSRKRLGCMLAFAVLLGVITWILWFGVVTKWPTWNEFTALFVEESIPVVAIMEATPEVTEVEVATETPTSEPSIIISYTAVATYTQVTAKTELVTYTVTPVPTSTPQPTATGTSVVTDTTIPTATETVTPVPTETPIPSATARPLPTSTPEPTVTETPRPSPTPTFTREPTTTPTQRPTATATMVPTATLTQTIYIMFEVVVSNTETITEAQLVVFAVDEESIKISDSVAQKLIQDSGIPYVLIVGVPKTVEVVVMTTPVPVPSATHDTQQYTSPLATPEVQQPQSPLPTTGPYQPQVPIATHSVDELVALQLELQREQIVSQIDLLLNQGYQVFLIIDPEFLMYAPYSRLYKLYTHIVFTEK